MFIACLALAELELQQCEQNSSHVNDYKSHLLAPLGVNETWLPGGEKKGRKKTIEAEHKTNDDEIHRYSTDNPNAESSAQYIIINIITVQR